MNDFETAQAKIRHAAGLRMGCSLTKEECKALSEVLKENG